MHRRRGRRDTAVTVMRPEAEMVREEAWTRFLRPAVQTTVAAATGFYLFLYGFDEPVAALYALFAPIALGPLASIAGAGRQRARVMVCALPFGLLLVVLGTALAASTWTAVAGMAVVGFLLGFAPAGGPRSAGAAPGLQLFYILACFPPYAPQTLPARLVGAAVGVLALAACNSLLFPGVPAPTYRRRLADALDTAASAAAGGHVPVEDLRARGERLRFSYVPPGHRPTGPGRTDRALSQAGAASRRLMEGFVELAAPRGAPPVADASCAALLARVAQVCAAAGAALRTGAGTPSVIALEESIRQTQAERVRQAATPRRPGIGVLRRQAMVLEVAAATWVALTALGIAERGRTAPPAAGDVFWYADLPTGRLWARRAGANLTRRSVWFQNAVRVALGLAAARLVAGTLDLAHGFWVLLAVLTLGRTTVGATWGAIRRAVTGNLVGAAAAGVLLLTVGRHTDVYAALLVPAMLVTFVLGPRWGITCAQALFTFLVALVFAQVTPVNWRLSEIRLLDVVTGSLIGLLCGLLAWPAGGRREVRRTMADLLRACGALIPPTTDLLTDASTARASLPTLPLLHRLRLAEAAYAQYRNEPSVNRPDTPADWHAVLVVAHQTLLGTQRLLRFDLTAPGPPSATGEGPTPRSDAHARPRAPAPAALRASDGGSRTDTMPETTVAQPVLVDLDAWLTGIGRRLDRISASIPTDPV
ncbi:FUSC family protein [Streptomyces sp. NPDC005574]|uniref:FUSC family protein n=1 Tax=Streptomyces sp. NPDC005574 TaxID=3156891 RepID=UPI0033B118DE